MQNDAGWIAVDWGTTNRRAYAFDRTGHRIDQFADAAGILAVGAEGFPAAVATIRERLGQGPMLLAGMIGSNRGWAEASYLPCPLDLATLAGALTPAPDGRGWIVPGARYTDDDRFDVMRGEEVQLLGAIADGLVPPGGLACLPGTHAKWAWVAGRSIAGFRTVMTGELFALLRTHSILAPQLRAPVQPDAAFCAGVDRSLRVGDLTAELFGVRARSLLADFPPEQASAFTSGLLIGADVRAGLACPADPAHPVALIGDPILTTLYAAALDRAGRPAIQIDGETAFLAGIKAIAETLP